MRSLWQPVCTAFLTLFRWLGRQLRRLRLAPVLLQATARLGGLFLLYRFPSASDSFDTEVERLSP